MPSLELKAVDKINRRVGGDKACLAGDKERVMDMKKQSKNRGQMTVEMVLILTIFIGLTYQVQRELFSSDDPEKNTFYKFITKPWKSIAVMMESGVWGTTGREDGRLDHPNHFKRMRSEQGTNPAT